MYINLNVRKTPCTQPSPPNRDTWYCIIFYQFLKRNWHRKWQHFGELYCPPPSSPSSCFVQASPKMTAPSPSLAGYWLYIRMSQWGFIFSFVSLFISPFSFQFEANQAASTSAQNCRVHSCTEIRGEPLINRGGLLPEGLHASSQTVGPGSLLSPNPASTVCAGILRYSPGDVCQGCNNLRSHF